jgi:hypothetical protein
MMKTFIQSNKIRALTVAAGLLAGATNLLAQDGPPPGSFDPAQMRQRMITRIREALEIKDEAEWQALSERIAKVLDARRAVRGPGPGGFGPGGPPPTGSPPAEASDSSAQPTAPTPADPSFGSSGPAEFRGPQNGPGGFRPELSPEAQALRKAIETKASTAELKTKLAEFKAARQKKQAELQKAQEELRQLLTTQQEAVAVTFGLL